MALSVIQGGKKELDFTGGFSIVGNHIEIKDPRGEDGIIHGDIFHNIDDVRDAIKQTLIPNLQYATHESTSDNIGITFGRVNFFVNDSGGKYWDYPISNEHGYRPDNRKGNCPIIDPVNADFIDRNNDRKIYDSDFDRLYFLSVIGSDNQDYKYDPEKISFYGPFIAFKLHMLHHLAKREAGNLKKGDNDICQISSGKPVEFHERILQEGCDEEVRGIFELLVKKNYNNQISRSFITQEDIKSAFFAQKTLLGKIKGLFSKS